MRRSVVCAAWLVVAASVLNPSTALAVRQPDYLRGRPTFEVARGTPARIVRQVTAEPRGADRAWQRFQRLEGGRWRSLWDLTTGVPLRVYGSGIDSPDAVGSAGEAERYAWELLGRHLSLLAPGASLQDFELVSNVELRGVRSVGFLQFYRGLRVLTGQVSFRFEHGRMVAMGSEALPRVRVELPDTVVSDAAAVARARAWIWDDFGFEVVVRDVEGPAILPVIRERGGISYVPVITVTVGSRSPAARWAVYVDARTGEPVARRQLLHFYTGQLQFNVSRRYPGSVWADFPAAYMDATVDGGGQTTSATGMVTWSTSATATVTASVDGQYVRITNEAGTDATASFSLADGGVQTWTDPNTEFVDAQLSSFVHGNEIKTFARTWNPNLAWLDTLLRAHVNVDDICNAYSDGNSIYLYRAGSYYGTDCENMGRISDVLFHEFGHSLHYQSVIWGVGEFDEAMTEGLADYLAATYNNDSGMGRGFYVTNQPLREIDPSGHEYVWPDDVSGDPHRTGLIVSGALWDLRKEMVTTYGPEAGVKLTDRLAYAIMRRGSDLPSSYVEALVEDDDDGDLSNGTPNSCAIRTHFEAHGLAEADLMTGGLYIGFPQADGLDISIRIETPQDGCEHAEVLSVAMDWHLRQDPGVAGSAEMTQDGTRFVATIPPQAENQVVRYRVLLELDDGTFKSYPHNPADPHYDLYLGEVEDIYCTGFETDPFDEGWTHGLSQGTPSEGADDWHWGAPEAGSSAGDPLAPYAGEAVIGNDLGGYRDGSNYNGTYKANIVNYAETPVIDATGYDSVRLQYRRWLTVENGHYDHATIYANGDALWTNQDTGTGPNAVNHEDREWRFQDVDLTPSLDADGRVQVKFELDSDGDTGLGGWTLDELCIVGYTAPACGDGEVNAEGEECDDGDGNSDSAPDACRTDCRVAACGDGVLDTGEECDDGDADDGNACSNDCVVNPGPKSGGCDCRTGGERTPPVLPLLFGLLLLGIRWVRRRR